MSISIFFSLLSFLVPCLIIGYLIYAVLKRALNFKELVAMGRPGKAKITQKFRTSRKYKNYRLRYAYHDMRGNELSGVSTIDFDLWKDMKEGDSIDIVYSERNPGVSAPKYLVERAVAAFKDLNEKRRQ